MDKEALIVIPGLDSKEVGFALNRAVDKIIDEQSIATVNKISTPEIPNMQSLEVTFEDSGRKKQIDVYEVFWGDIIAQNYADDLPIFKKVIFGLELVVFWIFSPIWRAAFKNKWMFIGICFSGLLITFWYVSIVGVFLSALDSTEVLDGLKGLFLDQPPPPEEATRMGMSLKDTPKLVSSFFTEIFLAVGVVLALFPGILALILRVSGFSMKIIKSQLLRDDVKNRVMSQVNAINKDGSYDRITFFAHSLGVIPTVHFLSEFENPANKDIKCITIGGAVSFLSYKTPLFKKYANESIANVHITQWYDYFSKEDWLCSYESIDKYSDRFSSEALMMDSSWLSRMSTKPHSEYFNHSRVIEKLIAD